MGNCLLKLDRLEEARILFEQRVKKVWDGELWFTDLNCNTCSRDFAPGAMHICAACPNNVICSECYPKRATAFQPRGCKMTHQYVEVGGKKWKALANGKVSDGETLEQWLHRQSQNYQRNIIKHDIPKRSYNSRTKAKISFQMLAKR